VRFSHDAWPPARQRPTRPEARGAGECLAHRRHLGVRLPGVLEVAGTLEIAAPAASYALAFCSWSKNQGTSAAFGVRPRLGVNGD
jgi:hypothetical protein